MGEFLRLCYILCLWSEKKQRIYFPRVLRKQIQSTESQSLTAQAGSVCRTPKNKGLSFSPHQAMPLYPSSRSIIAVKEVLVNSTSMILPRHGCTCRLFSAVSPAKWLPQQFTQPSAWIAALKLHNGRKPGSRFKREQLTIVI